MQINFTPTKIKEAKEFVNKLSPTDEPSEKKVVIKKKKSFSIKDLFKFLFK